MVLNLSRARLTAAFVLAACVMACLVFAWATRHSMERVASASQSALVDLTPWQTAQALAGLAVTGEETEYAREAERLADHEVDQAFASALREAGMRRHTLSGEALALSQKVTQLQDVVKEDQARVESLAKGAGETVNSVRKGAAAVVLADDLDVAKAQLGLDSDELTDAQQDLARAAGDERGKIQQELASHEAAMKKYDAEAAREAPPAADSAQRYGTLASLLKGWEDQRTRRRLIEQARQRATGDAAALMTRHNKLEQEAAAQPPAALNKTQMLATLNRQASRRQLLAIFDDRLQTEQQLASVYGKWSAQVTVQRGIVLHLMLQSLALIAVILLCVIILDALVRRMADKPSLNKPSLDKRRAQTLHIILKLSIQVAGVLLILMVVFGVPNQMPTILGLATAGLTVALQDFIVAFLGWFVLMGKNGIRAGDWVEIDGVGGEVVEIGLFRTTMLETGNWTDKGHPTGRRVTFMNSFAIRGQYFNFSTTGQWMWDELKLTVPSPDAYEMVERIQKAVVKETEKDALLAEEEWKRVTRQNDLGGFPASSAVDMRPGASGIDIIVRYVTRASDRFEVRNRLYQSVIDLLHKRDEPIGPLSSVATGDKLRSPQG